MLSDSAVWNKLYGYIFMKKDMETILFCPSVDHSVQWLYTEKTI